MLLKRIFPHPLVSLALVVVWLMLVNKVTLGNLIQLTAVRLRDFEIVIVNFP